MSGTETGRMDSTKPNPSNMPRGSNPKRCIVKDCTNYAHQGRFVGDLCAPCHHMITTGEIGPTTSFLRNLVEPDVEEEE